MNQGGVYKCFKKMLAKAGVGQRRFHDIRHTTATLLLAGHGSVAPAHIKAVAERLGHSSIRTTLETYCHVIPSLQGQIADRMSQYFDLVNNSSTVASSPLPVPASEENTLCGLTAGLVMG